MERRPAGRPDPTKKELDRCRNGQTNDKGRIQWADEGHVEQQFAVAVSGADELGLDCGIEQVSDFEVAQVKGQEGWVGF